MFKIISISCAVFLLCIKANATIAPLFDREIIRINENMYVGKKQLPFRNSDGSVNTEGDDVYFVFEKLTHDNIEFWNSYNRSQKLKVKNGVRADTGTGNTITTRTIAASDGVDGFSYSLDLDISNIWVTYTTRKNPADGKEITENDIEMTFSVFLNETAPITTHMGISRGYDYFKYTKLPHLGLAMELHAFAAKVSDRIYGKKSYMVTKPVFEMTEIVFHSFKKHGLLDYIWVGDIKQKRSRHSFIENTQRNVDLLKTFKNNPAEILVDKFWFEENYESASIMDSFLSESKFIENAKIYLLNNSSSDIISILREFKKSNPEWSDNFPFELKRTLIHYYDQKNMIQSEELTKAGLIQIMDDMLKSFVYNKIESKIESQLSKVEGWSKAASFHPEGLSSLPPLDNSDSLNWTINDGSNALSFKRPSWFPSASNFDGHKFLRYNFPTVIIDIQALSSLWDMAVVIKRSQVD